MKMRLITLAVGTVLLGMGGAAFADQDHGHKQGHPRVVHKKVVYKNVVNTKVVHKNVVNQKVVQKNVVHYHANNRERYYVHQDVQHVHVRHQPAYATVVAVQPIVRVVTVSAPRETCWTEEVVQRRPGRSDPMPAIVGGVVGGVIGNQVGEGRNKGIATVAGAIVGAAIGDNLGRREAGRTVVATREQCRMGYEQHRKEEIEGYRVTYRYSGETYTTRTDSHPGDRIKVHLAMR